MSNGLDPPPSGQPDAGQVVANFKLLLGRARGAILVAYVILAATILIISVPGWVVTYLQEAALESGSVSDIGTYSVASICTMALQIALGLVIWALIIGLYRPMRLVMLEGPGAAGSAGEVLKLASVRVISQLVAVALLGLAVAVGLVLCILPGVFALYFLAMAPYLVAVGKIEVGEGFKQSAEIAKTNVAALSVALSALTGAAVVVFAVDAGLTWALTGAMGSLGLLIAAPLVSIVGAASLWFAFVCFAAAFVSIEEAEGGVEIARG